MLTLFYRAHDWCLAGQPREQQLKWNGSLSVSFSFWLRWSNTLASWWVRFTWGQVPQVISRSKARQLATGWTELWPWPCHQFSLFLQQFSGHTFVSIAKSFQWVFNIKPVYFHSMGMEHRKYIINYEMVSWKLMSFSVHMVVHKLVRVKIDPLSKRKWLKRLTQS